MPLTIHDLLQDRVRLFIRCDHCKMTTQLEGERLILAHFRPTWDVCAIQMRLTCKRCGWPGQITASWPCEDHARRLDGFKMGKGRGS